MRNFFVGLFILLVTNAVAQNKDYIVSTEGIGAIKLDMTQAQLEKLLGIKIPLTNPWDTISGAWYDSAKIRYKNMDIELSFQRGYYANDSFRMFITRISASSPLCKTASGIGIGSDKLKIINSYNGYYMDISPLYLNEGTEKSKTLSHITVSREREGNRICFNLDNKKVVSFEIFAFYDDEE